MRVRRKQMSAQAASPRVTHGEKWRPAPDHLWRRVYGERNSLKLPLPSPAGALPVKALAEEPRRLHDGDFDHFMVNLPSHRLFLTAEENGKVIVIDTRTNKILHVITGLSSPHSIFFRTDPNKLFAVNGDASEIKVYNGATYHLNPA